MNTGPNQTCALNAVAKKRGRPTQMANGRCKRAHAMTASNTYVNANGTRSCRRCKALSLMRARRKDGAR